MKQGKQQIPTKEEELLRHKIYENPIERMNRIIRPVYPGANPKDVRNEAFFDTSWMKEDEINLKLIRTVAGNEEEGLVPAYHFIICGLDGTEYGYCDLRIGYNENVYYGGNIGYGILEQFRGHHYAGKACRLLFELARRHNMSYVIITCNPDNSASKKTCEYCKGELLGIEKIPTYHNMYREGEREVCIYRFTL